MAPAAVLAGTPTEMRSPAYASGMDKPDPTRRVSARVFAGTGSRPAVLTLE